MQRATPPARPPRHAAASVSPVARSAAGRFALAPVTVAALGLLVLGVALRLWLILRGWPALDSDEAIMGLMARHILTLGEHPIFFYGQHYLGVPDAYLVAGVFALLGQSTFALHLAMLALTAAFLALAYLLGRAAYGPAVGLLTLAFLALGPAFGLLREIAAIGGYQVTLLLGALLCLLVYTELRQPASDSKVRDHRRPPERSVAPIPGIRQPARDRSWLQPWTWMVARYALIGLVAGLGLWADLLMAPFVVAALLALALGRARAVGSAFPTSRWLAWAVLVAGLVIGALPFILYNIQSHGATFAELSLQNQSAGQHGFFPAPGAWLGQIGATLAVGLPALLGSPRVCVGQGGIWGNYPPALASTGPSAIACGGLNALYALAVLACYGVVAWQLARAAREWWRAHPAAPVVAWAGRLVPALRAGDQIADMPVMNRERVARLWLRAMLLLAAAGILLLYTVSKTALIYQFTAARYLLPLYVTLPLVFGVLWAGAWPLAAWLWNAVSSWAFAGAHPRPYAASAGSATPNGRPSARSGAARRHARQGQRLTAGGAGWMRGATSALAVLLLVVLLGFAAYGGVAATQFASDGTRFALPAPPQDRALLATLQARRITRFVSDYWTCYRLAFESGEQVRCAVRDGVNNTLTTNGAVNRYAPYLALIESTPRPAYLFAAGSSWDVGMAGVGVWAAAQGLPSAGYVRLVSAGYAIYYDPAGQG
jgi:hypothetical protein